MQLHADRRDWEDLSEVDLFWSILSDPEKRHGGWDKQEYLQSGCVEIDQRFSRLRELGITVPAGDALDFGCGAGRLSVALGPYFERVVGVDISAPMVAVAQELAAGVPNCRFLVNDQPHLRTFGDASFDFVFTTIVLQHLSDRAAIRGYLAEFPRILRPGGLLVFQLPSYIPPRHRLQPRARLYRLLRGAGVSAPVLYRRLGLQPIRMQFLPTGEVRGLLEGRDARVLAVDESHVSGIVSAQYYALKR